MAELAGHIEWAKARLIDPDAFEEGARDASRTFPAGLPPAAVARLYARYEHEKVRRGLIDFDDLLVRCAEAIESDPAFAAAQRWRWRHLFVDEFQDVNPLQYRLLLAWLGPSTDLCVVGDPDQAVYSWNGADPELLTGMPRHWPTAEVVRLEDNHRCSPQILAAAAAVLDRTDRQLRSTAADGPRPSVTAYASEAAEATGIAAGVQRAHGHGRRWGSLAVLTRTNAQLIPIQQALEAAGVPYWSPSQRELLHDPVAREVLMAVRTRPGVPLQMVAADLAASAEERSLGSEDRSGTLTALAELARTFCRQEPESTAAQWLAWLPTAVSDDPRTPPPHDAVTLCSFHRAKGLEWEAVWVAGLEEGLVPIGRAATAAAHAEERRLLYVALTRPSAELFCSWAGQRTFGSRPVPRRASPWLEAIRTAGSDQPDGVDGPSDAGQWRGRLRDQRRQLHDGFGSRRRTSRVRVPEGWPEPDGDLVRALQSWRADTARAGGVPAYVVLHDATLAALASLSPRTTEELLRVPGLGPVKAGRFGPTLLSLLADRAATG